MRHLNFIEYLGIFAALIMLVLGGIYVSVDTEKSGEFLLFLGVPLFVVLFTILFHRENKLSDARLKSLYEFLAATDENILLPCRSSFFLKILALTASPKTLKKIHELLYSATADSQKAAAMEVIMLAREDLYGSRFSGPTADRVRAVLAYPSRRTNPVE